MTKIFWTLSLLWVVTSCCDNNRCNDEPQLPDEAIVVLFDNDVHCEVDGYAKFVAQRNELTQTTPYVTTVSCGDFASGNIIGLASKGQHIVTIINEADYDVVTLGNHELDYGMEEMFAMTDSLEAQTVCANLKNMQTGAFPYPAYHMIRYGDVCIAYVGFATTTSGTVRSLSDADGNLVWSFMREDFLEIAQQSIDRARKQGAHYVVALSHLGDLARGNGHPSSLDLIAGTTGIDAVIDGHDHHVIPQQSVMNKDGEPVLLTSAGSSFQYAGVLTLTPEGQMQSTLIDLQAEEMPVDTDMVQVVEQIKLQAEQDGQTEVGYNEALLPVYDAEGKILSRYEESGLGNLVTDAFRNYTKADVALVNGGGIRAELKAGQLTYNDIFQVLPFGNTVMTVTLTGQQLLDALECSVRLLPEVNGGFMQVSGMKFEVDETLPTPVVIDPDTELYTAIEEGPRRVSKLQIWDRTAGAYKPVDPAREYTLASFDYLIVEHGSSGVLQHAQPIDHYWGTDVGCVAFYIRTVLGGRIAASYSQPEGRIVKTSGTR